MTRTATYQAGRTVAAALEAHFARHLAQAHARGEHDLAPAPQAGAIQAMIDATFWASLRPEEGRFPKISLAFLPPAQAGRALMFEQPLPLDPDVLAKLAPAVERPGIHLGVWYESNVRPPGDSSGAQLRVWGATRVVPSFGFVLEDVEPGLLVIKHRRVNGFGKYANVAVLTAVDGATVINDQYEVLAFGAKIRRPTGSMPVEQMVLTEPTIGNQAVVVPPVQHGGTRHLSAAQFVHDQRDALALVASQDGRFTVFAWSPCESMVHAHRVDVLLLCAWNNPAFYEH